jgi:hypothetical protein
MLLSDNNDALPLLEKKDQEIHRLRRQNQALAIEVDKLRLESQSIELRNWNLFRSRQKSFTQV